MGGQMSAFHHTRDIQADTEAVFQALSDPVRLARWWGPDGFTNTIHTFDFTPGGHWEFTMHGPDGASYPNQALFTEIIPNSSVVIKHLSKPNFLLSIALTPTENGTLVSWVQAFEDPTMAANIRHIVEPANDQNLARWGHEVTSFSKERR
jgi:uncharacterized protein YndB with AHSA1/START domain